MIDILKITLQYNWFFCILAQMGCKLQISQLFSLFGIHP